MSELQVAFFDSGIGGLNTMADFYCRHPQVQCLYYGDNANAPYGDKSDAEIYELVRNAFLQIKQYPIDAAVIACNTVTAKCIDWLRKEFSFPIIGTEPELRSAAHVAVGGKILLAATKATLSSDRVRRLIDSNSAKAEIVTCCPYSLAGDIEKVAPDFEKIEVKDYFPKNNFDAVVLGCTHYIYIKRAVQDYYRCPVFDGVRGTVNRLENVIQERSMRKNNKNEKNSGIIYSKAGMIDHQKPIINKCSQNTKKPIKIPPIFIGTEKNHNKCVFETMI